jgi:crossover junction endodeoxyribonuclease RuvC
VLGVDRKLAIVLGIDPGSRVTGYGLVAAEPSGVKHIDNGCIVLGDGLVEGRLAILFDKLTDLIDRHSPSIMAIEKVFLGKNAQSALKLGQARGTALTLAGINNMTVFEYSATQVKKALVGRGHADKKQIQHMVKMLLGLTEIPASDAADALAVSICHAHTSAFELTMTALSEKS